MCVVRPPTLTLRLISHSGSEGRMLQGLVVLCRSNQNLSCRLGNSLIGLSDTGSKKKKIALFLMWLQLHFHDCYNCAETFSAKKVVEKPSMKKKTNFKIWVRLWRSNELFVILNFFFRRIHLEILLQLYYYICFDSEVVAVVFFSSNKRNITTLLGNNCMILVKNRRTRY